MAIIILTPEEVQRALKLAESDYRPDQIRTLRAKIYAEEEKLVARAQKTGKIDELHARDIVTMKLELDGLYTDWAKGHIS